MGAERALKGGPGPAGRGQWPRLPRGRERAFVEWQALRRWGKLPPWERNVAGYLLRDAREAARLTQAELARRLAVSQQAVAQAERWHSNPTVELLRRWADACGATLHIGFDPTRAR